jgi:hypothetical protein
MRNAILSVIGLLLSTCGLAQVNGGAVFVRGGYIYAPSAGKELTGLQNQTDGFTNNFSLLGIEGVYRKNKWLTGFETSFGTQKARTKDIHALKPYTGAAHIRVGYIACEGKEYWLYPSAGMGVSMHNLSVREKILNKTSKIDNIIQYAPSVDLALNGDFLTTKESKDQKSAGGLILGFRMGYRFSLNDASWRNEEGDKIETNSHYRNNAYYVSLVVGFGLYKNAR